MFVCNSRTLPNLPWILSRLRIKIKCNLDQLLICSGEMNNMDKFSLKWSDFDTNIREHFRKLRTDRKLFDVTLATDDGQHIQAHKIILSAASSFFNDMFLRNNHGNMLIYLKGVSSAQLENITDFMYNGEAFVTQKELKVFLETGNELQVKGLLCALQEVTKDDQDNKTQ